MNKYKYETHLHTKEISCCGKVEAREIVRLYREAGYSGIVVTDHYYEMYFNKLGDMDWNDKVECYLKGYRSALEEGLKHNFTVLLGMELRFRDMPHDFLVYGIDEAFLKGNPKLYELGIEKFISLVRENERDILVYQAHPFRRGLMPVDRKFLDGIEVYNGHLEHDSRNDLAMNHAVVNGLKEISGTDFHEAHHAARGGLSLVKKVDDIAGFTAALKDEKGITLITS